MKKKQALCATLIFSASIALCGCSNDADSLGRENFSENTFKKDCSDVIQFDFSTLTNQQIEELKMFKTYSKQIVSSPEKALVTRSSMNFDDMDQNSMLVKVMQAMNDPEVASAIKNNEVELYITLLKEHGALPQSYSTRASKELAQIDKANFFWVYGALVAVVAVAWAAVVSDVIVIGPQVAQQSSSIDHALNSGCVVTIEANESSSDDKLDKMIDKSIKEAMSDLPISQQEYASMAAKSFCSI